MPNRPRVPAVHDAPSLTSRAERTLSEGVFACIADIVVPRAYPSETVIVVEGEPCEAAYFIAAGDVEVYRMSLQGRQQVLARLGSGQAFNTVPLFQSGGRNHASAIARTDVTLYALRKQDFPRTLRTCPDLALFILQDFATRLAHLTDLVEDLSLRSVRSRLARFLLQQADGATISQKWTQDEMAAYLGTVRDMIGRSLRILADEQIVRIDRGRIVLLDRAALEAEAQN
ncbi:MAG: Crp/Fnr family transcriptional regulator [Anaerolineae bacterium]